MQLLILQQGISVRILRKTLPLKKNKKIQKGASSDIRNKQLHLKELTNEILLTDHDYAVMCNDGKHCYTNSENNNAVVLRKKRKISMEKVLRDFGTVRGNVFKTQRKETKQIKKTDEQKTELKENKRIKEMRKFHLSLRQQIVQYSICYEAWPRKETDKNSKEFVCTRCLRDKGFPKKFSHENNMIPSTVPLELENLIQCEEMLIARAFPVAGVYKIQLRNNWL